MEPSSSSPHDATPAESYRSPWTLRAYDALPGNPAMTGIAFAIGLLTVFFAGRVLVDGAGSWNEDDLRVAVTQILLTAYCASAYAYVLMTARKTTLDLSPVARDSPQWHTVVERAGKYPWWVMPLVGVLSYLLLGVTATNLSTTEPLNPWDWRIWNYDVYWHRVTTVLFVWWIGCFCHAVVVESARLSRLSAHFEPLDILELDLYQPLLRQGLINALLVIGVVSVMSLLGVEARYLPILAVFWISFIVLAWAGMMLPLRGIRKKIRTAKEQELVWCKEALKTARNALKSGAGTERSVAEILAYRTTIEDVRNWPFDNLTLFRFTLYLLIPLGSWLGGALVERGLDFFLS